MKIKILWIDDDSRFLATMKTGLEKAGAQSGISVEVLTEANSQKALTMIRDKTFWKAGVPQVIFVDLVMPYIEGVDIVNGIKGCPWLAESIVTYITGSKKIYERESRNKNSGKLEGIEVIYKRDIEFRPLLDSIIARLSAPRTSYKL